MGWAILWFDRLGLVDAAWLDIMLVKAGLANAWPGGWLMLGWIGLG